MQRLNKLNNIIEKDTKLVTICKTYSAMVNVA